ILFSTLLGGSDNETAVAIAVDRAGNVAMTGNTSSLDFPVTNFLPPGIVQTSPDNPARVFVAKWSADSRLVFASTFGTSFAVATGVGLDADGNIYFSGSTHARDFAGGETPSDMDKVLLKSTDGGKTWRASQSGLNSQMVTSLEVVPSSP